MSLIHGEIQSSPRMTMDGRWRRGMNEVLSYVLAAQSMQLSVEVPTAAKRMSQALPGVLGDGYDTHRRNEHFYRICHTL